MYLWRVRRGISCAMLIGALLAGPANAQSSNASPFQRDVVTPPTLFTIPIVDLTVCCFENIFILHAVYTAGLVDDDSPVGATVDFFLFDEATGLPMQSVTAADICNPCSFVLGATGNPGSAPRKVWFPLGPQVWAVGGPAGSRRGFAQVVIGGDAANVRIQAESVGRFLEAYPVR